MGKPGQRTRAVRTVPAASRWTEAATSTWRIARTTASRCLQPDYPTPDPVHGLALNGSFEETPELVRWAYGGELPVTLVDDARHGSRAVRLGEPVPAEPQPKEKPGCARRCTSGPSGTGPS